MSELQTPIFLARKLHDAEDLAQQLAEVRIPVEICEVWIGRDQRGWQILAAAGDAERARSIATVLEVQRYGDWESRPGTEAHWGVIEDERTLSEPVEIYSAQSVVQAHLLKNLLAEQGITAIVSNQVLQGGSGIDFVGMATAAKVVVAAEDALAARELALESEERLREFSAEDGEAGDEAPAWPVCPECGARRTTRCPICATSGTDFTEADRVFLGDLAADAPEEECSGSCSGSCGDGAGRSCESVSVPGDLAESDATLLMCSVCDEPFVPEYPRHCEWCGHEFEDGYVIEQIVESGVIPARAIALVAAVGLFLLAGAAYFFYIVRS
ncbi:MAG: putative signal transducing protein [Thermoguttaceae bacterium]